MKMKIQQQIQQNFLNNTIHDEKGIPAVFLWRKLGLINEGGIVSWRLFISRKFGIVYLVSDTTNLY